MAKVEARTAGHGKLDSHRLACLCSLRRPANHRQAARHSSRDSPIDDQRTDHHTRQNQHQIDLAQHSAGEHERQHKQVISPFARYGGSSLSCHNAL